MACSDEGFSLKVLDLVGVADDLIAESEPLTTFRDTTATGELLGTSELPNTFIEKYSKPAAGVKRTSVNLRLKQMLIDLEVDV